MLRIKNAEDFGLGFNCMTRLYMANHEEEILDDMFKVCKEYLKWFSSRTIVCSLRDLVEDYSWPRSNQVILEKMKDNLLAKGMLTTIVDFPKYHEIFKGIGCAVSYFVADKNKSSKQYEFITIIDNKEESRFVADCTNLKDVLRGQELTSIANKVFNDQNMSKYTFAKLAFGIDTTGVFDLRVSANEEYNIKLVENVITSIQLLKPYEVCTGTYSVIYYTNDKESAYNAEKYIKTKFVRELLRCTIDARGVISGTTFEYVPSKTSPLLLT